MKVWNEIKKTVALARFNTSSMKDDVDRYSYAKEFYRTKTYTKRDQMMLPMKQRDFEEPYQVAQSELGGTWNDYNQPFIIQVGLCNLDCYFCFVPKELRDLKDETRYEHFTAEEVYAEYLKAHEGKKYGILRISGGEPFLAPDFIINLANLINLNNGLGLCTKTFLWIDTNLFGFAYKGVIDKLNSMQSLSYGICGCFKGFDDEDLRFNISSGSLDYKIKEGYSLSKQFENAKKLLRCKNAFFYIPEITKYTTFKKAANNIYDFHYRMIKELGFKSPLKITILKIKEYSSNKERMHERMNERNYNSGMTKKIWNLINESLYNKNLLWLPQYMIKLGEEK